MAPPRTLHIRCGTWEQVETFYSRKLRRGRLLSMRVPFAPALGAELTVGLELPNHEVMTIDGTVRKCEQSEGDARHWIEIELVGLSDERLRGLRDMVLLATSGRVVDSGISVIRGTDEVTPSVVTVNALAASAAPTVVGRAAPGPLGPPATPEQAGSTADAGDGAAGAVPSGAARPPVSAGAGAGEPGGPGGTGGAAGTMSRTTTGGATVRMPLLPPIAAAAASATMAPSFDEETASRAQRHPGPGGAAAVAPPAAELPDDERELFAALSSELRRLRQVAVHEVLDVSRDADAEEIRGGWMAHIRRFHPDVMARHRSDAVSHLAEELTILGNRAYDRLRVALIAEGRGAAFGPALFTPHGWLVGFDDLSTSDVPAARALAARPLSPAMPPPSSLLGATSFTGAVGHGEASVSGAAAWSSSTRSGPSPLGAGGWAAGAAEPGFEHVPSAASSRTGESFEAQARELLAGGDAGSAREVLATALVVYPRSRPLRSLYYVASALTALTVGQVVLATSQLETALAHHEGCVEASLVLDQIHRNGGTDQEALRRVFQ